MADFKIEKSSDNTAQTTDTLVVIFFFHGAKEHTMKKYCNVYHSYGFDVMYVPSYLKTFLRPTKSKKLVRNVLSSFLSTSCTSYSRIVIHAFSVGAYYFSVCMREMTAKPDSYNKVQVKIIAVIYDSLTIDTLGDLARMSGKAVSRNKIVELGVRLVMSMYFCLTRLWTVRFYQECEKSFKESPLKVPTLLFTCKNDKMSQYGLIKDMVEDWRRDKIQVVFKVWDDSEHCAHLRKHKVDYMEALSEFIGLPGLIEQNTKL